MSSELWGRVIFHLEFYIQPNYWLKWEGNEGMFIHAKTQIICLRMRLCRTGHETRWGTRMEGAVESTRTALCSRIRQELGGPRLGGPGGNAQGRGSQYNAWYGEAFRNRSGMLIPEKQQEIRKAISETKHQTKQKTVKRENVVLAHSFALQRTVTVS